MTLQLTDQNKQFCGFRVGSGVYAIPVLAVQEIVKPLPVTPIPLSQDYVRGLINLRGQIVTSLSLRSLFEIQEEDPKEHMNVIVKTKLGLFSLVVDEILEVEDFEDESMSPVPDAVTPSIKKFLDGVYKKKDGLVLLVNIDKIITTI